MRKVLHKCFIAGGTEDFYGRPNITGQIGDIMSGPGYTYTNGAFSASGAVLSYALQRYPDLNFYYQYPGFNAHNSNAVYTDSGKVYPASIALNFIIRT